MDTHAPGVRTITRNWVKAIVPRASIYLEFNNTPSVIIGCVDSKNKAKTSFEQRSVCYREGEFCGGKQTRSDDTRDVLS